MLLGPDAVGTYCKRKGPARHSSRHSTDLTHDEGENAHFIAGHHLLVVLSVVLVRTTTSTS